MANRRAKNDAPDARVNQSERFIEAARKAGCSEDEAVFDENLKKIARHRPPPKSPKISRTNQSAK